MNSWGDLLTRRYIRVTMRTGEATVLTLPGVLEGLGADGILTFDGLRDHQRQPWHSLLVQLGAACVARGGLPGLDASAPAWSDALVALAGGDARAFRLVVDDPSAPAFLQTPIPEGGLDEAGYDRALGAPDELDVIVTAKNHDVKRAQIVSDSLEYWLYALVAMQTGAGYLGRGNFGISRMNGGTSSRVLVSRAPGLGAGARWRHDVGVWLSQRVSLTQGALSLDPSGHLLLWTLPWSGTGDDALALSACDPFYIEVCRRVRLVGGPAGIECLRKTTATTRVDKKTVKRGVTGDVWAPVHAASKKTLTLGPGGFHRKLVADLLLGDTFTGAPALTPPVSGSHQGFLVGECLERSQGKTNAVHRIELDLGHADVSDTSGKQHIAGLVEAAARARSMVVYPALAALARGASGGSASARPDAAVMAHLMQGYDEAIDEVFHAALARPQGSGQEALAAFARELIARSRAHIDEAIDRVPTSSTSRYKTLEATTGVFEAQARKNFPELYERHEGAHTDDDAHEETTTP